MRTTTAAQYAGVTVYAGNAFYLDHGTLMAAPITAEDRIAWEDACQVDRDNLNAEERHAEAAAMLTRIAEIDLTAAKHRHPSARREQWAWPTGYQISAI